MVKKEVELEIEILEVYETQGALRVKTRCKYGEDNLGLLPESQYLDRATNEPKYVKEVKELLAKKYGAKVRKDVCKEHWGKKILVSIDK